LDRNELLFRLVHPPPSERCGVLLYSDQRQLNWQALLSRDAGGSLDTTSRSLVAGEYSHRWDRVREPSDSRELQKESRSNQHPSRCETTSPHSAVGACVVRLLSLPCYKCTTFLAGWLPSYRGLSAHRPRALMPQALGQESRRSPSLWCPPNHAPRTVALIRGLRRCVSSPVELSLRVDRQCRVSDIERRSVGGAVPVFRLEHTALAHRTVDFLDRQIDL